MPNTIINEENRKEKLLEELEEFIKIMAQFEREAKIKELKEEYKHARPLRKYVIWYQLHKLGIEVK